MNIDPSTTNYRNSARREAEGIVEKPDIVGAVFGQTEGLLGEELDLRDLQKSGRIGRIEVDVQSKKGRTEGLILIPSSRDQVETSIMAAALETIERVGPCKATIRVDKVEDVRVTKRNKIVERARQLLTSMLEGSKTSGSDLLDEVRASVQVSEIVSYGPERLPAGPTGAASNANDGVERRPDLRNQSPAEQFVEMHGRTGQVYKPEDDTLGPGEKDETPPRPQPTPRPPMPAPMRQEHRNEPRPEPRMEARIEPRPEPSADPEFE